MAWAIEVFLKTGKLEYPEEAKPCRAVADPDKLRRVDGVIPTDNGLFTDEEAAAEAGRCIRCQCDACMKYCDVCDFHNKWPMRIRDDVMATVAFSTSESIIKKTPAKRLMNTCTQCGLCDEVCPEGIEIGAMLLEARRSLHRQGTMPGAYHQFWTRDMEFTNGEFAALVKNAPGKTSGSYAFFPGCQLGAADPRYVAEPYKWLLSKQPDTGLLLRCCGVPAEWAGNEEMHGKAIAELREDWERLGKPVLIYACPACRRHLEEYLPEIETLSLYEALDQWGFEAGIRSGASQESGGPQGTPAMEDATFSIFDPCTARHVEPLEQAVRSLAKKAGLTLEELPKGDKHGCCGYGGHVAEANAEYAEYVAKKRSGLSGNPYIAYCINCRDIFKEEGKPVLHILDLLFDINTTDAGLPDLDAKLPDLTRRRRNRIDLKETLLKEVWSETMEKKPEDCSFRLKISPEVREKMDRRKILEEDLWEVIRLSGASKRRTYDSQKGTYTCYRELENITYWVEYRPIGIEKRGLDGIDREGAEDQDDGACPGDAVYEIVNAYTHRMKIKLEGVWNGRKTDIDL